MDETINIVLCDSFGYPGRTFDVDILKGEVPESIVSKCLFEALQQGGTDLVW